MGYTVCYLGLPGSFSYEAAKKYFKNNNNFIAKQSFREIFEAVSNDRCDYGIVPIKNTTIGPIEIIDTLLKQYDVVVEDEIKIVVHLHLLVKKNEDIKKIRELYSQQQAFAQCDVFISQMKNIKKNVVSDTASAANQVAKNKRNDVAAIASAEAAKLYGLKILKKDIQDKKNNRTTFIVIKNKKYGS